MWFCPHCGFGPIERESGITECQLCFRQFDVHAFRPIPRSVVRLTQPKANPLAGWLDFISAIFSGAGCMLAWYAFEERSSELLTAGKAIVGAGFALFLFGRMFRYLN